MTQSYQIVIVGGGNAGITVAAQLLLKNRKLNIAVIEPSDKHYYQPAWTLVGGGVFDINKTARNEAQVIPRGAHWIKQKVVGFMPEQNAVQLDNDDTVNYKYLMIHALLQQQQPLCPLLSSKQKFVCPFAYASNIFLYKKTQNCNKAKQP